MFKENRKKYIGARFTEKEKEFIKKIAEKRNLSLSDLVRESIFSHITFLEEFHVGEVMAFIIKEVNSKRVYKGLIRHIILKN